MAARTKVWFNLTRNVTANVIGQIISFSSALDRSPALRLRFITQSGCLLRRCDYHSLKINKYEPSGELGFSAVIFLSFSLRHRLLYFTFAWLVPPTFSGGFFSLTFFSTNLKVASTRLFHTMTIQIY